MTTFTIGNNNNPTGELPFGQDDNIYLRRLLDTSVYVF